MNREEETVDLLGAGPLRIIQSTSGYRFSLDPVLLCAFSRIRKGEAVADLGAGAGIIPLLLAERGEAGRIVGIERQSSLADLARRNARLNGFEDRIAIVEGDLRMLPDVRSGSSFDVVLTNPPYRSARSGRLATGDERAAARHELAGGLADFAAAAARLLRPGGRFYIVYLAERMAELLDAMRGVRLEPKRLRCVHSRAGEPARMVLVEGRRNGGPGMEVSAPLNVYEGEEFGDEVRDAYPPEGGRL